ncbi:MAG: deoxyribonuclease [bacterium]|nr:MAG: putative endonuclease 4 [bacterium 42_11]MDK2871516.1 deoxyribonuclease [bacterium]
MSISGGIWKAIERGEALKCEAIQIFTKNQLQWFGKKLTALDVEMFYSEWKKSNIKKIVAHTSYLINLASPDRVNYEKSITALIEEVKRCDELGIPYLVMHPGSHKGKGERWGIRRIADALKIVLEDTSGTSTRILLETTSGQGNNIGHRLDHLAEIMSLVGKEDRLGVCIDTAHIFASGYDISTEHGYRNTMKYFNRIIGVSFLFAFHLNDSASPLGSKLDRHAHIGKGFIGEKAFSLILNDENFKGIPMILETPKEGNWDTINLATLRKLRGY